MKCGPGCHCTNCTNTHTHHTTADNPEAREIEHLDEHQPDEYVDDNDTEQDEMKEDKKLEEIIRESVDFLCGDGADAQYMQYLSKSRITSPQTR